MLWLVPGADSPPADLGEARSQIKQHSMRLPGKYLSLLLLLKTLFCRGERGILFILNSDFILFYYEFYSDDLRGRERDGR